MQNRSRVSSDSEAIQPDCVFCQQRDIATSILEETPNFRIVADHAPLVEGHILIIPKRHYACYGAVPAEFDAELFALKHEVKQFFEQFYAPIIYWEHGIFHQTVFHAHLHCFPFGNIRYNLTEGLHGEIVHTQEDIRTWYATQGEYFYLEEQQHSLLFAPQTDTYFRVLKEVLKPGVIARNGNANWRTPQQRQEAGVPLIASTKAKWKQFQQREVSHANEASA